jgi:hypothetical protein
MEKTLMENRRPFLLALYPVGVMLILATVLEPALRVWPLRPTDIGWRFGAVGLAANTLAGVVFGLAWMLFVAVLLEHRTVLRTLAVISLLMGVMSLGVLGLFTLDFLQIRDSVRPELQAGFTRAAVQAVLLTIVSAATALVLGIGGWRSLRSHSGSRAEVRVRSTHFNPQSYGGSKA